MKNNLLVGIYILGGTGCVHKNHFTWHSAIFLLKLKVKESSQKDYVCLAHIIFMGSE